MDLLPTELTVRVRGVQNHGESRKRSRPGSRTAVNLGGIDLDEISRGMVLSEKDALIPTQILDARIEVLESAPKPLKSRQRVRVHLGTQEALARLEVLNEKRSVEPGEKDFVQIRFEKPVVAVREERLIIRQYSPQITIAGGTVIDSHSRKRKREELESVRSLLECLSDSEESLDTKVFDMLSAASVNGYSREELRHRTGLQNNATSSVIRQLVSAERAVDIEGRIVLRNNVDELKSASTKALQKHHDSDPLSKGIPTEELREKVSKGVYSLVFKFALEELNGNELRITDGVASLSSHSGSLSEDEKEVKNRLLAIYETEGLAARSTKEIINEVVSNTDFNYDHGRKILEMLKTEEKLRKITEDLFCSDNALKGLVVKLKSFADTEAENRLISVPQFKEIAGISRKNAIPILEYLDGEGVTRRAGNQRIVM